ncbi:hypothetical protein SAMN05216228_11182 [Rhizobium tibeticum]|uniref:Integrase catalytic domain-containing protein n=1 Tax=Rhizobium tibeticum TaxID=501024 RepID=A0A1H8X8Y6_9HYPH|nr:hypothetical protein RTCCBAU85039_6419 [Rhizobium tibeticum]SEP36331.1 hypothetical protein SAMN05216228_11182 [Rhizobium tibeticum]
MRAVDEDVERIASPELLPKIGVLPQLICSRRDDLRSCDEEGKHGDTSGIGDGDQWTLRFKQSSREGEDVGRVRRAFIANTRCDCCEETASLRRVGPGRRVYGDEVRAALVVVWEASDRICGKRLHPLLPTLIEAMERHGHGDRIATRVSNFGDERSDAELRKLLPFPLLGFDTDNDSVFMNESVHEYCLRDNIELTRCRPTGRMTGICRTEEWRDRAQDRRIPPLRGTAGHTGVSEALFINAVVHQFLSAII